LDASEYEECEGVRRDPSISDVWIPSPFLLHLLPIQFTGANLQPGSARVDKFSKYIKWNLVMCLRLLGFLHTFLLISNTAYLAFYYSSNQVGHYNSSIFLNPKREKTVIVV
jgi:hypothetical protein